MYNPSCDNNQGHEWEVMAKAWLSTLPQGKIISPDEIQGWVQSNQAHLPDHINSMPPPELHQRFASICSTITPSTQATLVVVMVSTDSNNPQLLYGSSIKDIPKATSRGRRFVISGGFRVSDDGGNNISS